jgi:hypothetical protein
MKEQKNQLRWIFTLADSAVVAIGRQHCVGGGQQHRRRSGSSWRGTARQSLKKVSKNFGVSSILGFSKLTLTLLTYFLETEI